jgi:CRISPR-associated protein Csx10
MLKPELSFQGVAEHGGFNRTWGLPLPQTLALAAGSVLRFQVTEPLDITRIEQLEAYGLGERRSEGFGRVAVNWQPALPSFTVHTPAAQIGVERVPTLQVPTPDSTAPTSESWKLASEMAERLLRQRMERQLINLVHSNPLEKGKLTSTQLSRLRIIARRALQIGSMDDLALLMKNLPQNAREKFASASINGEPFTQWLDIRICEPRHDWNGQVDAVILAGATAELSDVLAAEYTLRLIMAVARLAVKEVT